LKAAWTCRRKSGGEEEEEENEDEDEVVSAALVTGRTRFFGGGRDGRGRLASLSMAGSQRHFRQGEEQFGEEKTKTKILVWRRDILIRRN
jgi:hypothetical protein